MPSTRNATAKRRLFDKGDEPTNNTNTPTTETSGEEVRPAASVMETPQKKRRVNDFFRSPSATSKRAAVAVVTPEKEEDHVVVEVGTPSKTKAKRQLLPSTPSKPTKEPYIPTHIHKSLSYQRQGKASLPDNVRNAFELVQQYYSLPDDLEQNRAFGPLSGTCFEERAILAYNLSMLEPKKGKHSVEICSSCATLGHKRNDCPDLI